MYLADRHGVKKEGVGRVGVRVGEVGGKPTVRQKKRGYLLLFPFSEQL